MILKIFSTLNNSVIQLLQPAQHARLSLFAAVCLKLWWPDYPAGTGRWLLGKGACERKGWGQQSRDSVLTSGTCRNRYIYGWGLCTVADFPCPLEQGNESLHLCSNSLSQWSSMHVEKHRGVLCILPHLKKTWLFPTTGRQLHKEKSSNYRDSFTFHFMLKISTCRTATQEFQVKH